MRAVWSLLLLASVALVTVRTHHRLRRHAESTISAQTASHQHHARSHRLRATIPGSTRLPTSAEPIIERVIAQAIEAPIDELAAPVARGPPSG